MERDNFLFVCLPVVYGLAACNSSTTLLFNALLSD